jgi:ABC-type polysaccharide/polyol phosphate transport system ATPase subunit
MPNAVEVTDVSMTFLHSGDRATHLKEYLIKAARRQLRRDEPLTALQGITLSVAKGDSLGIVGLNGSGKSTLLKIISGIMRPTSGRVRTEGVIAPLIELGAGFDMELTARENIYLNGSALGHSKRYMEDKFGEIVEFSEMGDFMDVPMKNFSSGMAARVGFAVATATNPDILVVDEILSVGDFKFRDKCEKRISALMSENTTVLLVSHSTQQIRKLCRRAIWLEHGKAKMAGNAEEVCDAYGG